MKMKYALALISAIAVSPACAGCDPTTADARAIQSAAPRFFAQWCPDTPTAVHETTHYLSQNGSYRMAGGALLARPDTSSLPAPMRVLRGMFHGDYADVYLTHQSSSGDSYEYLLDELNAYSVETIDAPSSDGRNGLAAIRSFVNAYRARVRLTPAAAHATDVLLSQASGH